MYSLEARKTMEQVNKKWVKVLTVITYVISVSVVALVLGLYYKLAWKPKYDNDNYNIKNNKYNKLDADDLLNNTRDLIQLGTLQIRKPLQENKLTVKELRTKILGTMIDSLRDKNYQVDLLDNQSLETFEDYKSSIELESNLINKLLFSIKLKVKS